MPGEFPMHDPQNIWQNQPTEAFKMSVDTLRYKAQQFDRKARLAVLASAAVAILLFLYFGWGFLSFSEKFQNLPLSPFGAWSMRLGFGVLSLWALYNGRQVYKWLWPRSGAPEKDLDRTLQSYRNQLEKRRDYSQNIWLRSGLIFCFLGMAMVVMPVLIRDMISPRQLLLNLGPIFMLFILWLGIFIPARNRRQRKLQQEIEQLHAFEREYSG